MEPTVPAADSGWSNCRVEITPMRLKDIRGLGGIALWIWVALVLCAFAPDAEASGLIRTMPSLWATATALGLMLITAVSANQK